MGRAASINLDDVRNARSVLIAGGRPHGIIAIRNQIGRGSPQLISRYLAELDDDRTNHITAAAVSPRNVDQAWQTVSRSIEHLIRTSDTQGKTRAFPDAASFSSDSSQEQIQLDSRRIEKLEKLVTQQQASLNRIEVLNRKLEEQLMQQQDLFDSWRHEQHAERQLLKTQFDQLAQFVSKKPVKRLKKKGEQLDLYRDSEN